MCVKHIQEDPANALRHKVSVEGQNVIFEISEEAIEDYFHVTDPEDAFSEFSRRKDEILTKIFVFLSDTEAHGFNISKLPDQGLLINTQLFAKIFRKY